MNFFKLVFIAAFIFACGFGIFELTRPEYPAVRILTNHEGRTLNAKIVGREGDTLFIERLPDTAEFDISTETLLFADRIFARRLRESPRPTKIEKPEPVPVPKDRYIQVRKKEIERLRKQENLFEKELASDTMEKSMIEKRTVDLQKVQKEIRVLELSIETYNYQRKK